MPRPSTARCSIIQKFLNQNLCCFFERLDGKNGRGHDVFSGKQPETQGQFII